MRENSMKTSHSTPATSESSLLKYDNIPNSSAKVLWAYSAADEYVESWHEKLNCRRRARGYDVKNFCVTPESLKRRWFPFQKLHQLWKWKYPPLMRMYRDLQRELEDRDVLVLYNGANLHPDFVSKLKQLRVYTAGDDPESTEVLTKPCAPAFDIQMVNNVSCLELYWSWGLTNVYFWPLGSLTFEEDVTDLSEEKVLDIGARKQELFFAGERLSPWRKNRLERLRQEFPSALFVGRGWDTSFLDWEKLYLTYRQTQIGWNLHNSLGPVNFRTFDLAAMGVMQICDNKRGLARLYKLGQEAIGFDSIDECIDLTKYYLLNVDEQRRIALAGMKRWKQDYSPDRVWESLISVIDKHLLARQTLNISKC